MIGYVAIDSTVAGRSRGGLRLVPDLSADEIRAAARAMTLKYGFLGLPQGGAKAGIFGDPDSDPRARADRLGRFAVAARELLESGAYVPDADMGTTAPEVRTMMQAAGLRVARREWQTNRSGDHTARSCLASAAVLAKSRGLALSGARVAIEGFGKVGASLATQLAARGARVVAISTSRGAIVNPAGLDVRRLSASAARRGSWVIEDEEGRVDREALLELDVDLLCPCARFQSIHAGNVDRVRAAIVCAGANDPMAPEAELALHARGVAFVPDFVSNAGGVLGGTLEFSGVDAERTGEIVETLIGGQVTRILELAAAARKPTREIAETIARARHDKARAQAESRGPMNRLMALALDAYRSGLMPRALAGQIAPALLARRLSQDA